MSDMLAVSALYDTGVIAVMNDLTLMAASLQRACQTPQAVKLIYDH